MAAYDVVSGDILRVQADAIVNPWNRNTIPYWLLLPQGVSGAIKRVGGKAPFQELRKSGRLALGQAVATGAGELSFKGIIHVAGINDFWRASEDSIRRSVRNAVALAQRKGWMKIGMPLIGAGSGRFDAEKAEWIICDEISKIQSPVHTVVVRYHEK